MSRTAMAPRVLVIDATALGSLAGVVLRPGRDSATAIGQIRERLAGVTATARLLDAQTADAVSQADYIVVADLPAEPLAAAARALKRPVLSLQSWPAEAGVWSELIEASADGQVRRIVGGATMMAAHAPQRSLSNARRRSIDFVRRWFVRLPDPLPAGAAGDGAPPVLGTSQLAWQSARALASKVLERARRKQQWVLHADRPAHPLDPIDFAGGIPILPDNDHFWADPFPVCVDGRQYVFFEELPFATNRGHISVLEILPDGRTTPPVPVLVRPYHLSYPSIFEWQGQWYMMPECSENQCLEVYRCERWPDRWTLHAQHFNGERMADPSLIEHEGRWWMFATRITAGVSLDDELYLFHAETPLGPWIEHPANPIVDDARWARPAGRPLIVDGKLLRPAQNCGRAYGESMSIREVLTLSPTEYRERELVHLRGDPGRGLLRTHTLNLSGDLRVVDAMRLI